MSYATLTINYQSKDADDDEDDRGTIWARLEQEYQDEGDEYADINDLYQMLSRVMSGQSALSYIADLCPYVEEYDDGKILGVHLDFFVWPSDMDLNYEISTNLGIVSNQIVEEQHRSFDLIFNGSDYEEMPFIGDFTFTPEMPFIGSDGDILPAPKITVEDDSVELSESCHTVFRVDGLARGYRHTLTMLFTVVEEPEEEEGEQQEVLYGGFFEEVDENIIKNVKIENLKVQLTLTYTDDGGEQRTETLDMAIPKCVEDLLAFCPDGQAAWFLKCLSQNCDPEIIDVYWNACDGEDIVTHVRKS